MNTLAPMSRERARELNLKNYLPESPCLYGHYGFRNVASGACRDCRNLARRGIKQPKTQNVEPMSREAARKLGLKRFMPLAPCENGHESLRNTARGYCLACHAAAARAPRLRTPKPQKLTVLALSDAARAAIQAYADQWLEHDRKVKP